MPAGRPSGYRVEFCELAHSMCQNGATDQEVADALGIDDSTLYRWRNTYPEFREALKIGKSASDDRVEMSLYRRAIGYNYQAIKIMQYEGEAIVEPYVEHVPPDIGAMKLWLTNRRGNDWRDKVENHHTGEMMLAAMSEEEIERRLQAKLAALLEMQKQPVHAIAQTDESKPEPVVKPAGD